MLSNHEKLSQYKYKKMFEIQLNTQELATGLKKHMGQNRSHKRIKKKCSLNENDKTKFM